jgi:DNA-binding response OmpR family regulator
VSGQRIPLTTYEFLLLSALARRAGQVLSRDRILDSIANRDWQPYDRSIDVLVGKLRRKLNDDPRRPRIIRTIRGVGYMLSPPAGQG